MITVLDTETCGLDGGIVEIAGVLLDPNQSEILDFFSSLVQPDREISVEAMSVHHITPSMVRTARPIDQVIAIASEKMLFDPEGVLCAHNAPFDSSVMPPEYRAGNLLRSPQKSSETLGAARWVCTYRCALHMYPEAPRHGNQYLRYWLGLDCSDMPEVAGLMPHRALYDAWVTAKILARMLENASLDQLLAWSGQPAVLREVRFGKHRGKLWSQVDQGYLRWILQKSDVDDPDVLHTARHYSL